MGGNHSNLAKLHIRVEYCGGWHSYYSYYKKLKSYLFEEFGTKIYVKGYADDCLTGNFEVIITETGEIIHSKKAGEGLASTEYFKKRIKNKIKKTLKTDSAPKASS